MASDEHRTQITVAVIGLIGVLAAAIIANWDRFFPRSVPEGPESDMIFDFLAEANRARWTSGFGSNHLSFNGRRDDPKGFAVWVNNESLEDNSTPPAALLTHPEWKDNDQGQITGDFTLREQIQPRDRFRAQVGFLKGNHGEVEFVVEVYGGALVTGQSVYAVRDNGNDRSLKAIDADLTPMTGGTGVRLVVNAGATSGEDQAVWVNPRIERQRKRK